MMYTLSLKIKRYYSKTTQLNAFYSQSGDIPVNNDMIIKHILKIIQTKLEFMNK
jgi:hypothetical protein